MSNVFRLNLTNRFHVFLYNAGYIFYYEGEQCKERVYYIYYYIYVRNLDLRKDVMRTMKEAGELNVCKLKSKNVHINMK